MPHTFKTTIFKGDTFRVARYLVCEVTKGAGHLIRAKVFVGPSTPDWALLKASLVISKQPNYGGVWWVQDDTYGPLCPDTPDEAYEASAMLLCAAWGFRILSQEFTEGPWGWPVVPFIPEKEKV